MVNLAFLLKAIATTLGLPNKPVQLPSAARKHNFFRLGLRHRYALGYYEEQQSAEQSLRSQREK